MTFGGTTMKKMTKLLSLVLAVMMLAVYAVGCAPKASEEKTEAAEPETIVSEDTAADSEEETTDENGTHTVTDGKGNEVEVPNKIERVAIISSMPLASVYCMVAGDNQKIVGLTAASKNAAVNSFLTRIVDDLDEISTDFSKDGSVNVEEVLLLEPDVVFYNTNNASDCEAVEKLKNMGIACVGFSTTIGDNNTVGTFQAWVKLLGEVLGESLQADAIVKYGEDVQKMVADKVAALSDEERKSAIILSNYANNTITCAGSTFGRYWLGAIGAENPSTGLETPTAEVNLEQLYQWDPEVIFLNSFSAYTAEDILNNTAGEGQDWSGITAVKNGKVYKMPLGMYYWFPPCSDSPLALQWLAKNLYPELFSDLDMDAVICDYYSEFYGIELTEEDLNTLYNPPAESAWQ